MVIGMVMVGMVGLVKVKGWDRFDDIGEMKGRKLDLFRGRSVLGIV